MEQEGVCDQTACLAGDLVARFPGSCKGSLQVRVLTAAKGTLDTSNWWEAGKEGASWEGTCRYS